MANGTHRFSVTTSAESTFGTLPDYTVVSEDGVVAYRQVRQDAHAVKVPQQVEKAVFAHIKAMRTLGHKALNTADVAAALSLPRSVVDRVVLGLRSKGVKVPRG